MNIALAASNQKLVSSNDGDAPLTADRVAVGPWEQFALLVEHPEGWVQLDLTAFVRAIVAEMLPAAPIVPPPPAIAPWATFQGSAQEWFSQLVYGKPFGQQTLLALEPTLLANGWQLTGPNTAGDRTKVAYQREENGQRVWQWIRVGFGEGAWVWVVQA